MTNSINIHNLFSTSDIRLAAYLFNLNYKLDQIDTTMHEQAVFNFIRDEKLDDYIQIFWSRSSRVEPISQSETIKHLLVRIKEEKRNGY